MKERSSKSFAQSVGKKKLYTEMAGDKESLRSRVRRLRGILRPIRLVDCYSEVERVSPGSVKPEKANGSHSISMKRHPQSSEYRIRERKISVPCA